jgi:hypothetical protein
MIVAKHNRLRAHLGFHWDWRIFPKIEKTVELDKQIARACFRAKKIFPELVYNTTALEDNPFTFPEVQTLLEGITVGGHKIEDERQVLNQAAGWKLLIEKVSRKEFTVTKEMFCALHSLVSKEEALVWGGLHGWGRKDCRHGASSTESIGTRWDFPKRD